MELEWFFWICIAGAIYSYLLYPAVLLGIRATGNQLVGATGESYAVSIIIAGRNEANRIAAKIEDTQQAVSSLSAVGAETEVIVVSDASEDGMDDIVQRYSGSGVALLRLERRGGKEVAQDLGLRHAKGSVVIFTDVATRIKQGSLSRVLELFGDASIGAISSEDEFVSETGAVSGEGLYVKYEMWLRELESRRFGLVGMSGSFFAARREVCTPWSSDLPSDFLVALNCAGRGLRAVSDAGVVGIYPAIKKSSAEFSRKRRTALRGMAALAARREVLNPVRYGGFAFQVWSHKVMRWLVPWFLLGALSSSAVLASEGGFYLLAFITQLAMYALAMLGWRFEGKLGRAAFRIPYYFCQVNLAMAVALVDFLRGRRQAMWEPSRR